MSKPVVAIVGRPNVGKSTLFNALAGERISIVQDTPGVTRDRIYAEVSWLDHNFTMIDTGGIEPDSNDIILSQMREQAEIAIATADVIMFIVDVRQGLQDSDSKVADMLRRSGKPVVLVVNKVDSFEKYMADVYEFYNLGIGDPFPVSAASMLGLGDMLDEVVKYFPEYKKDDEEDDRPKIAIIGKPNVGKSSLINKLAQEDRVIVSDIAGTTRDAIDTDIKYNGKEYVFIDTAGLRRKNKIKEEIERVEHVNVGASKPVQELLEQYGSTPLTSGSTLGELIRRPDSLSAARLAGYKNFFPCRACEGGVFVPDWGLTLRGISAGPEHSLLAVGPDAVDLSGKDYAFRVLRVIQDVGHNVVLLRPDGASENAPVLRIEAAPENVPQPGSILTLSLRPASLLLF